MAAIWGELAVREVKTEQRCKLCKHPKRSELDLLLLQRSQRATIDGQAINGDFVKAKFIELGVENPTHENLTSHWKNHCEVVSAEEEQAIDDAVESLLANVSIEELGRMTTAERLDLLEQQGYLELQARIKRTGKSGLTIDQLVRIAELKQRQKSNEEANRLMNALGAGVVAALQRPTEPRALPAPAHPVLEAEVVREEVVET
jgi:hypothetical protein